MRCDGTTDICQSLLDVSGVQAQSRRESDSETQHLPSVSHSCRLSRVVRVHTLSHPSQLRIFGVVYLFCLWDGMNFSANLYVYQT